MCACEGGNQSYQNSKARESAGLPQNQEQDFRSGRSKRHADSDLTLAL
jgi:hypothetical protein